MNWDFVANSAEEIVAGIGHAFCAAGGSSETIPFERAQMIHLLKALAFTSVVEYPFRVRHTSDKVPDFQLKMGKRRIGVELTRIGFQDLECGRGLQARGYAGTLSVSNLFPRGRKPRNRSEVLRDGFLLGQFVEPVSLVGEAQIWASEASAMIKKKNEVLRKKSFNHGEEDWLVVIDNVGESLETLEKRADDFAGILAGHWEQVGWFSKVFLQDYFIRWQVMFTADGYLNLPG